MQKIRWFFLIVAIVLALSVALQNNALTEVQLLWIKRQLPLSVLLLATSGMGFLLGALLTASMLRSRAKQAAKQTKQAASATAPVEQPAAEEPQPLG